MFSKKPVPEVTTQQDQNVKQEVLSLQTKDFFIDSQSFTIIEVGMLLQTDTYLNSQNKSKYSTKQQICISKSTYISVQLCRPK